MKSGSICEEEISLSAYEINTKYLAPELEIQLLKKNEHGTILTYNKFNSLGVISHCNAEKNSHVLSIIFDSIISEKHAVSTKYKLLEQTALFSW
jgi:hypothetical protein